MMTPARAMIWQLYRLVRWEFVCRLALDCFLVLWLLQFSRNPNAPELMNLVGRQTIAGMIMVTLFCSCLFSTLWLKSLSGLAGYGYPLEFSRPVSTRQLVFIPLVSVVLVAVVSFALPAGVLRLVAELDFPIVGPILLIGLLSVILVAGVWSCANVFGQIAYIIFTLTLFVFYLSVITQSGAQDEPILLRLVDPECMRPMQAWNLLPLLVAALMVLSLIHI